MADNNHSSGKTKAKDTTSKADQNGNIKDSSEPGPIHPHLVLLSPDSSLPTNVDIVAVHDINQAIETAWAWASMPGKDTITPSTIPPRQSRDDREHETRDPSSSRRRSSGEKDPQVLDRTTPTLPTQSEQGTRQTTASAREAAWNEEASTKAKKQMTALDGKGKEKATENMDTSVLPAEEPTSEQILADKVPGEPGQYLRVQDGNGEKRRDSIPDDDTQPPSHPRFSIGFRGPSLKPERSPNWLSDLTKLGGQIGQPRVMAFGYVSSRDGARFDQPLEQLSTAFISNLLGWRKKSNNLNVPLVFIGTGLGCLIIQEAIRLTGESEEKYPEWYSLLNMTAGILFLNAPAPAPVQKKQPNEEPTKEGTKAEGPKKEPGVPRAVFPPAVNARGLWVDTFLRQQDIDSGELCDRFQSFVVGKPVVWFYDSSAKAVGSIPLGVFAFQVNRPLFTNKHLTGTK
jgi:hypothetical protein